jgi:hypothetical protein
VPPSLWRAHADAVEHEDQKKVRCTAFNGPTSSG